MVMLASQEGLCLMEVVKDNTSFLNIRIIDKNYFHID
jgi:hypothetical protein